MLETGTRLGPYEILAAIGAGGMGEVYKARDTRLDRTVAIKVLPPHLSDNPSLRERFEREARAISALSHPNICALYDVGTESGSEFLVMELLEGESLADRLGRGPLSIDQALRYGTEIADALDKAHRQSIVHRDLKPGNIMITKGGAKLLDFGLARYGADGEGPIHGLTNAATAQRALTAEGQILGTFQYMAPEQLEGQTADARTDIFALGAVLYEMLTGRRAFEGKTRTSIIAQIVSAEPPRISTIQPVTPPSLERVVSTCMAKDPDDRWQTAHDVVLELKWIAQDRSQPDALRARSPQSRTLKAAPWILAAAAAVAAIVFAVLWQRGTNAPPRALRMKIAAPAGFSLQSFVVSPDGQRIAASLVSEEGARLGIRDLSSFEFELLPPVTEARSPAWSPDSRSIAFFADRAVWRIDLPSGKPQKLCAADYGVGLAWLEGGAIVFAPHFGGGLHAVSADGGEPRVLTVLDTRRGESLHGWPAVVPGQPDLVLYLRRTSPSEPSVVRLLSMSDGKASDLIEADALVGSSGTHLYVVRGGVLFRQQFDATERTVSGKPETIANDVVYQELLAQAGASVDASGRTVVFVPHTVNRTVFRWFDRSGKPAGDVSIQNDATSAAFSPDGGRLATERFDPEHGASEVWTNDLARGVESRLTNHPAADEGPMWSPDGRQIAFNTDRFGLYGVAVVAANGSSEARTLVSPIANGDTWIRDWSADGSTLLIEVSSPKTNHDLWIVSATDPAQARPYLATAASEEHGTFSPDGKWIAYNSTASGAQEVYIQSYPRSDLRYQVSTRGGGVPHWTGDGSELIFESSGAVVAVPVSRRGNELQPGTPRTLFPMPADSVSLGHSVRNRITVSSDGQKILLPIYMDGRKPAELHVSTSR